MDQEQIDAIERERRRCQAYIDRLNSLLGDPDARAALDEAWQPLLPTEDLVEPKCPPLPYEAPELLP